MINMDKYTDLGIKKWIVSSVKKNGDKLMITTTRGRVLRVYHKDWVNAGQTYHTRIYERNNGETVAPTYWTNL